jgi:HD-like signal output (HDOD) protein
MSTPLKRILFVGSNRTLGQGFAAAAGEAKGWTVSFAEKAAEALFVMEKLPREAVVAETHLPDRSGVELLEEVQHRHPQTTRVLLSAQGTLDGKLQAIGKPHHHLHEPATAAQLLEVLERAEALRTSLPNPTLPSVILQMHRLPSPPEVYHQLVGVLNSGDASLDQVGELILQDPALCAKLLHLANAATTGLRFRVNHPMYALAYLGLETTKALVLLAQTCSCFEQLPATTFNLKTFQEHSLAVGRYAQQITKLEPGRAALADQAFSAGLLHDLGKLLLAANLPPVFKAALKMAREQGRPPWEMEAKLIGANHAEVGAYVLGTWNLSVSIIEAVAWHHAPLRAPGTSPSFSALTAVHVANELEHQAGGGPARPCRTEVQLDYLKQLGCEDRLTHWTQSCTELDCV